MIRAGALFYAVVISSIIALLSGFLILTSHLSGIESANMTAPATLGQTAASGIQLLLSEQSILDLNEKKTLDIFNDGGKVLLSRKTWGAYKLLSAGAKNSRHSVVTTVLAGSSSGPEPYALWLADEDRPLALCGKTLIKGAAFLPASGIKRAYIEGQNFIGNQFVEGTVKKSNSVFPILNKTLLSDIASLFKEQRWSVEDSIVSLGTSLPYDSISNSFRNASLALNAEGSIYLEATLSGNILVTSPGTITVSSSARLENIIISAPKIIFREGFEGTLQAFASDSILLEKNVTLHYPSVLCVMNEQNKTGAIVLSENDSVSGSMLAYRNTDDIYSLSHIYIPASAFVYGEVICNGITDLQGTITGSLSTQKIMLKTRSSVYENHLLNAVINREKLSLHFGGIDAFADPKKKRIITYLQ